MADENTAKTGAEPENKVVNTGLTAALAGAEPAKDAKPESSPEGDKPAPFDKDPRWKSARLAEKKLQELLKANELDDPDDLVDLVRYGKGVKGKLRDINDLDDIIRDAEEIRSYRPVWAEQEERKRRSEEDPEQRASRLEKELKSLKNEKNQRELTKREREEAEKAIQQYNREVKDIIEEMEIPKEQSPFVMKLCGVDNPFNEVDLNDRKAIKRVVAQLNKEREAYDQAVIKRYLDGKSGIPKVGAAESTTSAQPEKITMKNAKSIFAENVRKAFAGG